MRQEVKHDHGRLWSLNRIGSELNKLKTHYYIPTNMQETAMYL